MRRSACDMRCRAAESTFPLPSEHLFNFILMYSLMPHQKVRDDRTLEPTTRRIPRRAKKTTEVKNMCEEAGSADVVIDVSEAGIVDSDILNSCPQATADDSSYNSAITGHAEEKLVLTLNEVTESRDRSPEFGDELDEVDDASAHESKGFQCRVCHKSFTRKYHLERHLNLTQCSGQPPPAHACDVCGKVYTRRDNLREHLRLHAGQATRRKRFQCPECQKTFHGASLLKIHERTHTGEKPFQCDFCRKSFPSGGALTKHRRVHTGEKPYQCPDCDVRFTLKGTLNRHMRVHTGVRPHKCPHCDKEFIQSGGLKAHMFHHTQENGFVCQFCDKVFNRKARLQMHTRYVHEKERPFECQDCDKKFTRKEDLNRHSVLHTGSKSHECSICNKKFAIKPSLKLHLLTHTKEEPRPCPACARLFIRRDCLLRHMRNRHRVALKEMLEAEKEQEEEADTSTIRFLDPTPGSSDLLADEQLVDAIKELLTLLVDETTLKSFGWPDAPIHQVLESVITRCGHTPVDPNLYQYSEGLRENSKLLFTVVIDDHSVKMLLNNQSVDEVITHVLRLAKQ